MTENKDLEAEIHPLKNEEVRTQDSNEAPDKPKETKSKKLTKFGQLSQWRTAAFFLVLFLCLIVVFAFSFIIPCPVRPSSQRAWIRTFENAVTYPFLTLWDANKDKVADVMFVFKDSNNTNNGSCVYEEGLSIPCAHLTLLSGTNGSLLWKRAIAEDIQHVQCGVQNLSGTKSSGCLVIGIPHYLTAISSSGETLWRLNTSLAADLSVIGPALVLPDLDGDEIGDLLLFFVPDDQGTSVNKLIFLLISGKSGDPIGQKVYHNITKGLMPSSPLIHITNTGAYYILFIQGNVQGVALKDIYAQATGLPLLTSKLNPILKKSDPEWEKKTDTMSGMVEVYRSKTTKYLQQVQVPGKKAGKLLISTNDAVELLDGQSLQTYWYHNLSQIQGVPLPGYFNMDGVFDFLIEDLIEKDKKKVTIVDGKSGKILWEEELIYRENCPKPSSVNTISRSIFLFWGELPTQSNVSLLESFSEKSHNLYMVHPSHPNVILELKNSTENVVASTTALFEQSRHAGSVLLLGQPLGSKPGLLKIIKQKLKDLIYLSRVRRLKKGHDDFGDDELREYFHRMRYSS
ncbi:protein FAM234A [Pristis pectinata]|uniref:protein FAM234A n=1 Tax=Pristis pectinata TaxID=685728 RepID=UPI00223CCFD5|nr:protein FAM234A [Pristis pectinata]XP_051878187.1 protein FAM234A [Pristis pectinata]XP_051878188.1 protein FAM234A [Pristis pectinata]XP_051878189.1 protein FAM234A [Pristis pectinata]